MNWSGPNLIHFGRKSRFGPDQFILVVTISFWLRPNHYGQVQINFVRPKPFWTHQICFDHIEGQGISFAGIFFFKIINVWKIKVIQKLWNVYFGLFRTHQRWGSAHENLSCLKFNQNPMSQRLGKTWYYVCLVGYRRENSR